MEPSALDENFFRRFLIHHKTWPEPLEDVIIKFMENQGFEAQKNNFLWCPDSNAGFHPVELLAALNAAGYTISSIQASEQ